MQNKVNFLDAKMNVTSLITVDYENIANWTLGKNKANSNPIQTQSKPIQCQNKPNQTQSQNPTTTPTAYANISNKGFKLAILAGAAVHTSQDASSVHRSFFDERLYISHHKKRCSTPAEIICTITR